MCNQRDTGLPAMAAAFSDPSRFGSWLISSGLDQPLRVLLREVFVTPVLRRLRLGRHDRAASDHSGRGAVLPHRR